MLNVQVHRAGPCTEISLSGELDLSNEFRVEECWRELVASPPGCVLIDLRELRFLDCRGASRILRCGREAAARQWDWAIIIGNNRWVQRVFTILQWEDALPMYPSPEAAIRGLGAPRTRSSQPAPPSSFRPDTSPGSGQTLA